MAPFRLLGAISHADPLRMESPADRVTVLVAAAATDEELALLSEVDFARLPRPCVLEWDGTSHGWRARPA